MSLSGAMSYAMIRFISGYPMKKESRAFKPDSLVVFNAAGHC